MAHTVVMSKVYYGQSVVKARKFTDMTDTLRCIGGMTSPVCFRPNIADCTSRVARWKPTSIWEWFSPRGESTRDRSLEEATNYEQPSPKRKEQAGTNNAVILQAEVETS